MKRVFSFRVVVIASLVLTIGCHKPSPVLPACGCDAATSQTLTNQNGALTKNELTKEYYILVGTPGIQSQLFICDTTSVQLKQIIANPPNLGKASYAVNFSGELKNYCKSDTVFYINFVFNIRLSDIKTY